MADRLPPLPPGFTLDQPQTFGSGLPPIPPGFTLDKPPSEPVGYAEDITKSAGSGLVSGTASLVGAPADLSNMAGGGLRWLLTKALEKAGAITPEQGAVMRDPLPGKDYYNTRNLGAPTANELLRGFKGVTGVNPSYQPQTVPGEFARTAGEFAPAVAAFGFGSLPQRVAQLAVPAVASETAGQVARKVYPEAEGAMRIGGALVGGIGTGLAQMRGTGLAQMRGTPQTAISEAIQGADSVAMQRATALMQDAASQGVRLTWDEAIQHATGGATRLSELRRYVENSRGGGSVLKPMMAERPGQVQAAADTAIGNLAPVRMDPVRTGIAAKQAAEQEIAGTQAAINAATDPYYKAAVAATVAPARQQALLADPIYAGALKEIRGNPALNRTIESLPDDSVAVVDLVQRRLREMADNALAPGQASTSNLIAANLKSARAPAIDAAEQATGGPTGSYATARLGQTMLRGQFLEPLTEGPLGAVAATGDALRQGRAILPTSPPAGSAPIVSDTVTRIAMRHPDAAANVIHHYVRSVFDEATQSNLTGPNQFGGAKFASVIAGNGQQAQNLEAAVKALPNGSVKWEGFRRFLDTMEATGQRPAMGSATAFNQMIEKQLSGGGAVQEAAMAAPTLGTSVFQRLREFQDQLNRGRNTTQIAHILSDPASGKLLERLAAEPPGSSRAAGLAVRLSLMGSSAGQSRPQPNK